ncbi:MAG: Na+/H+ antiporter NhaA [Bacteroidetes bacterium]|nr:MAG: Na+/H+ antiporter NhaA [Bacteroidota bacterium]MBL1143528.1 Na+/H+ antiporter NhaA [Bacteroidota bacterium]MCB0801972.1 Na+/H+ antiporter NhaA [Flavobacteriales bacterium]NOG56330.1 Na+/H+ antiporter NhaA [Bacteroidota bacterium]
MKRSPIDRILMPVDNLLKNKPISGILLFVSVIASLIWVNSPYAQSYHDLWHVHFKIGIGDFILDKPLHLWINDGLMAIFFFVVGLEIKREILAGELSTIKQATLPIAAAIGGMAVPALVFMFFNINSESESGWGIPMATDIAFALGVLSLLGKRVPLSLKIFLTALAIVDDLGAVLVIAFFYTENLLLIYLEYGLVFFLILAFANWMGVRNVMFYAIVGICGLWVAFLFSGVHATIAGVLLAMTIPAKAKINKSNFLTQIGVLLERFRIAKNLDGAFVSEEQQEILEEIKEIRADVETPSQKLEYALHPLVSFIILPLFALSNSGIVLDGDIFEVLTNNLSLGIILGLIVGKFLGIFGFTTILIKLGVAKLPKGTNWGILAGAAIMGGIGFTMSIFISDLALNDQEMKDQAKMAILLASFLSGLIGFLIIKYSIKPKSISETADEL